MHIDLINEMKTTIKSCEYYRKREKKQTDEEKNQLRTKRKEQKNNSNKKKNVPKLALKKGLVFDYFFKEIDSNRREDNTGNDNYDTNDNNNNNSTDEILKVKTYENHFRL